MRSRLLRALPTTMALVALQRTQRWWTVLGLSCVLGRRLASVRVRARGARQLTTDDLRDPGDALANLRRDSVVSNAMSADTEFHVNYRQVELQAPFLVVCATDGCFGYLPTPMHFEHLVLEPLTRRPAASRSGHQRCKRKLRPSPATTPPWRCSASVPTSKSFRSFSNRV